MDIRVPRKKWFQSNMNNNAFLHFWQFILLGIFDDSSKFYSEIMMYSKIRIRIVIPKKTLKLDFGYTGFVTLWLSSYWILLLLVCMSRNNFLFVFPYYYIILNHFENRNVRFTLLLTVDVCFYFTRAEKYLFRKKKFPRVSNSI